LKNVRILPDERFNNIAVVYKFCLSRLIAGAHPSFKALRDIGGMHKMGVAQMVPDSTVCPLEGYYADIAHGHLNRLLAE
jgi:hypothetical protein